MGEVEPTEQFRALCRRPEAEVPLDVAALLIAARARPGLDLGVERARLDRLAEACWAPTLDALARHLWVEEGFRGDRHHYYDPRNSYLDQVLDRRLGIPISLGVLALSVGRRIGVPLAGVSMPGHFLLRDRVDPEVFVDPFSGRILDRSDCRALFAEVGGSGGAFDDGWLEPVGSFAILARMLANLRSIFGAHEDRTGLLWVLELRSALPDAGPGTRAELAAALAACGRLGEAARTYDELALAAEGEPDAEQYRRKAIRLRARLN